MQTVKLNMIPGAVMPVVNVSQYDEKRQFALQVYEGATAYSLSGKSVQIRGTKPDGNGFAYDATDGVVSVSGSTVTISTTKQMTAVGGQTMAELRITSGSTILGSINFIIDVEPSALSDDTPISGTEIPAIERQLEEIIDEIEGFSGDAEAWAVGERDGEPVPSSDPTYHNNAKYYASNALSSATTASAKAGEAATSATNAGNSATTAGNAATTATTKAGEASTSATNAGNSATAAAADSLEAEGWAVGEQGGTPVGPTSPYYHNNAKYYSEQTDVTSLASMSDVDLTSPTNNQVLKYDATTQKWVNGTGGGGGADALDDLTDVTLTSPADGDLLQYDPTSGKWVNSAKIPNEIAAVRDNGAVNYAKTTLTTQAVGGVTFTVNSDGTVDLSNTSTSAPVVTICDSFTVPKDGSYKLTGCPSGGSGSTFIVRVKEHGGSYVNPYDEGGGAVITLSASKIYDVVFSFESGVALSGKTIKPMVSDAALGLSYDDYHPYSMTNRELTEAVTGIYVTKVPYQTSGWRFEANTPQDLNFSSLLTDKQAIIGLLVENPTVGAQYFSWCYYNSIKKLRATSTTGQNALINAVVLNLP